MDNEQLRNHFKANMLDGDEIQAGQMIASTEVWGYLQDVMKAIELAARIKENEMYRDDKSRHYFSTPDHAHIPIEQFDERITELKAQQKGKL